MLTTRDIDEIVFQVILSRMHSKKQFANPISLRTMQRLVSHVTSIFEKEPIMLKLDADITIVGDIHGNIDDLLRIFEKCRYPPAMKYLFLGDYVDRGSCGTEVLTLLFALKAKYPNNIFLLRGNHETLSLTHVYGFEKEISAPEKYNMDLYYRICEAFEELPICAIVGKKIFCVHGGISPLLKDPHDLLKMQKPQEELSIKDDVFTDMVWSDPACVEGFTPNGRGCGYLFGPDVLTKFLDDNNLDILIRSHEMCQEGVAWPYADDDKNVDKCLTVFSNSDYCGRGNSAAVLHVSTNLLVNVELIPPMTAVEMYKRKVLLPFWLYDLIATKEARMAKTKSESKLSKRKSNNIVQQQKIGGRPSAAENIAENL